MKSTIYNINDHNLLNIFLSNNTYYYSYMINNIQNTHLYINNPNHHIYSNYTHIYNHPTQNHNDIQLYYD